MGIKLYFFEEDGDINDFRDWQELKDPSEWLGLVRWSEKSPSTASEDSGSLVLAREGNIKVSLGIHLVYPASILVSACLSA